MGLFDELSVTADCPSCGKSSTWHAQYKYGSCRCRTKSLGDSLDWTGTVHDVGSNVGGTVAIDGICENCPHCGLEVYAVIVVEMNRLASATLVVEPPPGFEVIKALSEPVIFSSPPSPELQAFMEVCGHDRLYRLFWSKDFMVERQRLAWWQEELLREFRKKRHMHVDLNWRALLEFIEPIERVFLRT